MLEIGKPGELHMKVRFWKILGLILITIFAVSIISLAHAAVTQLQTPPTILVGELMLDT